MAKQRHIPFLQGTAHGRVQEAIETLYKLVYSLEDSISESLSGNGNGGGGGPGGPGGPPQTFVTVQDEYVTLAPFDFLNFAGAGVTAAVDGPARITVTIPGATGGGGAVSSVFGRTGAVTAQAGDYTAAQVTNAVNTLGAYSDPSWITSLAWGKITGAPSSFPPSAHVHSGADITTGTVAPARLGSGVPSSTTFLRGDGTWQTVTGGGGSQTPWTSDIDGAGFTLKNPGKIGVALASPGFAMDVSSTDSALNSLPVAGAKKGFVHFSYAGSWGLQFGHTFGGAQWMQAQYADGTPGTFSILINPIGGNVGIGVDPVQKLHVMGNIACEGLYGNYIMLWSASDNSWRIGMSDAPGFSRVMCTAHVNYLVHYGGTTQGFALGDAISGLSAFEVGGSAGGYKAFFRGNVGIGNVPLSNRLHLVPAANAAYTDVTAYQLRLAEPSSNPSYAFYVGYTLTTAFCGSLQAMQGGTTAPIMLNPNGGNVVVGAHEAPPMKFTVWGGRSFFNPNGEQFAIYVTYSSAYNGMYIGCLTDSSLVVSYADGSPKWYVSPVGNMTMVGCQRHNISSQAISGLMVNATNVGTILLNSSSGGLSLHGIENGAFEGQLLFFTSLYSVTFMHSSLSVAVGKRIYCPTGADMNVPSGVLTIFMYSVTIGGWVMNVTRST